MPARTRSPWGTRLKGLLAAVAVVGFFGIAVAAPFTLAAPAVADAEFYERIHQQFVPEAVAAPAINVGVAPLEEIPKPEPVAASARATMAATPRLYTGGGSPAEWMAAAGIPESDWWYVDQIISRESGWNPNATNASSGACGLAQAYPCGKIENPYDPVANLTWANAYAQKYGGWVGAYEFWESNHWW